MQVDRGERLLTGNHLGTWFKITYDSEAKLLTGASTDMPSYSSDSYIPRDTWRMLQAMFGLYIIRGLWTVPEDKALNGRFPGISTTSVEDVLGLWKGK